MGPQTLSQGLRKRCIGHKICDSLFSSFFPPINIMAVNTRDYEQKHMRSAEEGGQASWEAAPCWSRAHLLFRFGSQFRLGQVRFVSVRLGQAGSDEVSLDQIRQTDQLHWIGLDRREFGQVGLLGTVVLCQVKIGQVVLGQFESCSGSQFGWDRLILVSLDLVGFPVVSGVILGYAPVCGLGGCAQVRLPLGVRCGGSLGYPGV